MEKSPKLLDFLSSLLGSAESGKINRDRKCLFCGTKLSDDGLKTIRVRMGRLRYLLRSKSEGSTTASELLYNILETMEYHGGRDIPENDPDWWLEAIKKIDLEKRERSDIRFPLMMHVQMIKDGLKTQMRRSTSRFMVGSTYSIQPILLEADIIEGQIHIMKKWAELRGHVLSEEEARAEGNYTPELFESYYETLHPGWIRRYAYKFRFVPTGKSVPIREEVET